MVSLIVRCIMTHPDSTARVGNIADFNKIKRPLQALLSDEFFEYPQGSSSYFHHLHSKLKALLSQEVPTRNGVSPCSSTGSRSSRRPPRLVFPTQSSDKPCSRPSRP